MAPRAGRVTPAGQREALGERDVLPWGRDAAGFQAPRGALLGAGLIGTSRGSEPGPFPSPAGCDGTRGSRRGAPAAGLPLPDRPALTQREQKFWAQREGKNSKSALNAAGPPSLRYRLCPGDPPGSGSAVALGIREWPRFGVQRRFGNMRSSRLGVAGSIWETRILSGDVKPLPVTGQGTGFGKWGCSGDTGQIRA